MTESDVIIRDLALKPHPEGGYYVETWRADAVEGERATGSAIYYLLRAGERSAWHRVDAVETWHFYAGSPLRLSIAEPSGKGAPEWLTLGPDVRSGERPQIMVPERAWQSAVSLGVWTLAGCTVSPAFRFEGFELATEGWEPGAKG